LLCPTTKYVEQNKILKRKQHFETKTTFFTVIFTVKMLFSFQNVLFGFKSFCWRKQTFFLV